MATDEVDRELAEALKAPLRRHSAVTGLSQEQLAHDTGIGWKYYQSLENGRRNSSQGSIANPTAQVFNKLARADDVTLPDLVSDSFGAGLFLAYAKTD